MRDSLATDATMQVHADTRNPTLAYPTYLVGTSALGRSEHGATPIYRHEPKAKGQTNAPMSLKEQYELELEKNRGNFYSVFLPFFLFCI